MYKVYTFIYIIFQGKSTNLLDSNIDDDDGGGGAAASEAFKWILDRDLNAIQQRTNPQCSQNAHTIPLTYYSVHGPYYYYYPLYMMRNGPSHQLCCRKITEILTRKVDLQSFFY